ncbi:hypothetical protein [Acidisphaera sp. L21]|uniref:hypothetical protein n=1 Tax=Acidisphaera sp. L21 TaxID=1641851 RepID=UPI00131DDD1E|nr:hypothetical protein [Acidisphaera sp. L21]
MNQREARFPNTEIVVHEDEWSHWFDDNAMAAATKRSRTRTFHSGEVLPGITTVPCPGHTPGHCACRVRAGTEGDDHLG